MYRCVVLSEREDLLGSVLHNMVASWSLSERIGANYVACYQEPRRRRPNFCLDEVFDVVGLPFRLYRGPAKALCPGDQFVRFGNESPDFARLYRDGVTAEDFPEGAFVISTAMAILARPGQTRGNADREFSQLFGLLPLHKAIRHAMDAIKAKLDLSAMVAVHIRRGDIIHFVRAFKAADPIFEKGAEWYAYRYSEIESFLPTIDLVDHHSPLLIFSEDANAAAEFSRVSGRNCTYAREALEDVFAGLTPTQCDFLEILLISSTKAIVGTSSLFAKTGAAIGDIRHFDSRRFQRSELILRDLRVVLADDPEREIKLPVMVSAYCKVLAILGLNEEASRLEAVYSDSEAPSERSQ